MHFSSFGKNAFLVPEKEPVRGHDLSKYLLSQWRELWETLGVTMLQTEQGRTGPLPHGKASHWLHGTCMLNAPWFHSPVKPVCACWATCCFKLKCLDPKSFNKTFLWVCPCFPGFLSCNEKSKIQASKMARCTPPCTVSWVPPLKPTVEGPNWFLKAVL